MENRSQHHDLIKLRIYPGMLVRVMYIIEKLPSCSCKCYLSGGVHTKSRLRLGLGTEQSFVLSQGCATYASNVCFKLIRGSTDSFGA